MEYGMVSFVGAGPGDPELLTVKGKRLIEEADLVIYAGSLVPKSLVESAKKSAVVLDSAPMTLEETHEVMRDAAHNGKSVVRLHTGDPSLYGAVREQAALLERDGIPYRVIPGVTAAFAAAAAARVSFTTPETVQSFTVTRLAGRTDVPEGQSVGEFARHGGSVAVYLSAPNAARLQQELLGSGVDPDVCVVAAYRVGWPEEKVVRTRVGDLAATAARERFERQTVFLVLPGEPREGTEDETPRSRLYAGEFAHGFREGKES